MPANCGTGFGIASQLPHERQAPSPPVIIADTLAYMAPEQTGVRPLEWPTATLRVSRHRPPIVPQFPSSYLAIIMKLLVDALDVAEANGGRSCKNLSTHVHDQVTRQSCS